MPFLLVLLLGMPVAALGGVKQTCAGIVSASREEGAKYRHWTAQVAFSSFSQSSTLVTGVGQAAVALPSEDLEIWGEKIDASVEHLFSRLPTKARTLALKMYFEGLYVEFVHQSRPFVASSQTRIQEMTGAGLKSHPRIRINEALIGSQIFRRTVLLQEILNVTLMRQFDLSRTFDDGLFVEMTVAEISSQIDRWIPEHVAEQDLFQNVTDGPTRDLLRQYYLFRTRFNIGQQISRLAASAQQALPSGALSEFLDWLHEVE